MSPSHPALACNSDNKIVAKLLTNEDNKIRGKRKPSFHLLLDLFGILPIIDGVIEQRRVK